MLPFHRLNELINQEKQNHKSQIQKHLSINELHLKIQQENSLLSDLMSLDRAIHTEIQTLEIQLQQKMSLKSIKNIQLKQMMQVYYQIDNSEKVTDIMQEQESMLQQSPDLYAPHFGNCQTEQKQVQKPSNGLSYEALNHEIMKVNCQNILQDRFEGQGKKDAICDLNLSNDKVKFEATKMLINENQSIAISGQSQKRLLENPDRKPVNEDRFSAFTGQNQSFEFKCQICNKYFKTKDRMRMHNMKFHSENSVKDFTCLFGDCGKTFVTKQQLGIHSYFHKTEMEKDIIRKERQQKLNKDPNPITIGSPIQYEQRTNSRLSHNPQQTRFTHIDQVFEHDPQNIKRGRKNMCLRSQGIKKSVMQFLQNSVNANVMPDKISRQVIRKDIMPLILQNIPDINVDDDNEIKSINWTIPNILTTIKKKIPDDSNMLEWAKKVLEFDKQN